MSATTKIQWADKSWNPVRGCSIVSPGCVNCYAMKQAHRFSGPGGTYEGLTKRTDRSGPQWTGEAREIVSALNEPLGWKKPQRIFVNSMSDLFHDGVSDEFILNVFTVMAVARRHTFQVLTKRPDRMQALLSSWRADDIYLYWHGYSGEPAEIESWPLPNVWLGTSVENQHFADERIPLLLKTPAAVRFISAEPLLGPVDLAGFIRKPQGWKWSGGVECRHGYDGCPMCDASPEHGLDLVIAGGESGGKARPCYVDWLRSLRRQCRLAGVAYFLKQLGSVPMISPGEVRRLGFNGLRIDDEGRIHLHDRKGGDMAEWAEVDRVREFPAVPA